MEAIHEIGMTSVSPRRRAPSLLWLLALLLLFGAGQRHGLWGNDEPREAEMAREMYVSRDWVVPRLDGYAFLEKPPLAYWGAALVFHAVGGPSAAWCRAPSAFWGLVGALAAAWLGGMLAGPAAGMLAALILATCGEWLHITHYLLVDVPLAACVALSLALFWQGYRSSGGRKGRGYFGCALAVSGAFMSKGMVGVIIPASAIAVFLVWRRERRELARLISPGNVVAVVAVPLAWLCALWVREGAGALRVFVWDNQVLRFVSSGADHAHPPWYYAPVLFEVLLPWAIFLPPAVFRLFRPSSGERIADGARQYLIAVVAAPFIVLSIASGKRHLYLLPLLPGFAIMIAAWIAGPWRPERAKWECLWLRVGLGLFALLPIGSWGAAFYFAVAGGHGVPTASIGMAASVLLAGAAAVYALRTGGERLPEVSIALLILAYGAALSPSLWAMTEEAKGYADFEKMLSAQVGKDGVLYLYGWGEREVGLVCFNLGRTVPVLRTPDELPLALRPSSGNRLLISEKAYSELRGRGLMPPTAEIIAQSRIKRKTQLLLRP